MATNYPHLHLRHVLAALITLLLFGRLCLALPTPSISSSDAAGIGSALPRAQCTSLLSGGRDVPSGRAAHSKRALKYRQVMRQGMNIRSLLNAESSNLEQSRFTCADVELLKRYGWKRTVRSQVGINEQMLGLPSDVKLREPWPLGSWFDGLHKSSHTPPMTAVDITHDRMSRPNSQSLITYLVSRATTCVR